MAKNGRVALCQRQTAGDAKSCLKGRCTNFHLQPFILGSGKDRGKSGIETPEERLGMEALRRALKE